MDEEKLNVRDNNGDYSHRQPQDIESAPRASYAGTAETCVEPECGHENTYGEPDANQVNVNSKSSIDIK